MNNTNNNVELDSGTDKDKIFERIKDLMKSFFYISVPILLLLGLALDRLIKWATDFDGTYLYIILPLFAGILFSRKILSFFHKRLPWIIDLAAIFTVIVIIFFFLKHRYPDYWEAVGTREKQEEIDKSNEVEAPHVESFDNIYDYKKKRRKEIADSVIILLPDSGVYKTSQFLKDRVQQDSVDQVAINDIQKTLKSMRNSSEGNFVTINKKITETYFPPRSPVGTKDTLWFKPGKKEISDIYLYPGQGYRVYPSVDCKVTVNKLFVNGNEYSNLDVNEGGYWNVTGISESGYIVFDITR